MTADTNVLNLPSGWVWDVYDAGSAARLLHNATTYDVDKLLADRTDPVTIEPVGGNVTEWRGSREGLRQDGGEA